jgi:hypothetical protein
MTVLQSRTARATAARRAKLFSEWEKRLQRMGLGEQAGRDEHFIQYGAKYFSDTKPFCYGLAHDGHINIFGTTNFDARELSDIEQLIGAESMPVRRNTTPSHFTRLLQMRGVL